MTDKTRKQHHRIAADGSVMTFMTVEYMLCDREYTREPYTPYTPEGKK